MPLFINLSQYTLILSRTSLSLNHFHFISHIFEHLGFMPDFKNPFVVELSVLRGVSNFFCSNTIKYGRMSMAVFPLLNMEKNSASAA